MGGEDVDEPFPEEVPPGPEDDFDDEEELDPETERLWRAIDKADHPSSLRDAPKEDDQGLQN